MPLITICGGPCTGKSTTAANIRDHFSSASRDVTLVSDQSLFEAGPSRDQLYSDVTAEKRFRSALKDHVTRILSDKHIVIFDALNYIKGVRYEIYCMVKSAKTTQVVLFIDCNLGKSLEFNSGCRHYSETTIRALYQRFETPNPTARWDSPLVAIRPGEEIPMELISECLFNKAPAPPNLSTQNPPRLSSDHLYDLDKITQSYVSSIMNSISASELGQTISLEGTSEVLILKRRLTMPELQRIRRHFLTFYKTHSIKDPSQIPSIFMQFVSNAML